MDPTQWCLLSLGAVVLLLLQDCFGSSLHSLHHLNTVIFESGHDRPHMISLAYVDDLLISRYDRDARRFLPQTPWANKFERYNVSSWDWQDLIGYNRQLLSKMNQVAPFSQNEGFHTLQRISGCELDEHGHRRGFSQHAYDGRELVTWITTDAAAQVSKRTREAEPAVSLYCKRYLEEGCIERLQTFLVFGKGTLLRREPPVVKVRHKAGYDVLDTLICRVYGFYPKEIDATWRKDGEVWEQETFRGGVTPNSDGTYHTWLSIEIDPKERSLYQCHVEHDSLLEPLRLTWEDPASMPIWLIVRAIGGVLLVAILLGAAIIFYIKKRKRDGYKAASMTGKG
ncbi:major histocompatibility complex class I-related gene protein-like isoform X2 [Hemicordylus capensis]|uniref:major histocompatibility complex class I-related gene protein-like isoform X2 n=1 Tax=Hemicordylus capensis TaxID=884348 RepID=UPI002304690A|nr:major histocompatibility complex class I-related gene protein-like isoform X2 [Hemicordylus capensis]